MTLPFIAAALLAPLSPAGAQAAQSWPSVVVTKSLAEGWVGSFDATGRAATDDRSSQLETRIQLGHTLGKRVTAFVGWVHFNTFVPRGHDFSENQVALQVNWVPTPYGRFRLSTRTRLEQRFVSIDNGTAWRLREQVRGALPIQGRAGLSAVLWVEPFLALDRTVQQSHGLDQLRTFAGLSIPLSQSSDLELGYLNQRVYRAHDTLVNHAIPLVLIHRF